MRINRLLPFLFIFYVPFLLTVYGCKARVKATTSPDISPYLTPTEKLFPPPYFPLQDAVVLGIPVGDISPLWKNACVFSPERFNQEQLSFFQTLLDDTQYGEWGTSFTRDFDGDGFLETAGLGAFERNDGTRHNFILVTRKRNKANEVVFLHEFAESEVTFYCFHLHKDMTLAFGNSLIGSELTMQLTWESGKPKISYIEG